MKTRSPGRPLLQPDNGRMQRRLTALVADRTDQEVEEIAEAVGASRAEFIREAVDRLIGEYRAGRWPATSSRPS